MADIFKNDPADPFEVVPFNLDLVLETMGLPPEMCERYKAIESAYSDKIEKLRTEDFRYFLANEDYEVSLIQYLVHSITRSLKICEPSDPTVDRVVLFLSDPKRIDNVVLVFTYFFADQAIHKLIRSKVNAIDFSFVALPMYKLLEKTMCELVKYKFPQDLYKDGRQVSQMTEKEMMLGEMTRFLHRRGFLSNRLFTCLKEWVEYDRNGYAHKRIMDSSKIHESSSDSFRLLFEIILLF